MPTDIAAGLLLVGREQRKRNSSTADESSRQIYADRHQALGLSSYRKVICFLQSVHQVLFVVKKWLTATTFSIQ